MHQQVAILKFNHRVIRVIFLSNFRSSLTAFLNWTTVSVLNVCIYLVGVPMVFHPQME